jgi:hypothetical protein
MCQLGNAEGGVPVLSCSRAMDGVTSSDIGRDGAAPRGNALPRFVVGGFGRLTAGFGQLNQWVWTGSTSGVRTGVEELREVASGPCVVQLTDLHRAGEAVGEHH